MIPAHRGAGSLVSAQSEKASPTYSPRPGSYSRPYFGCCIPQVARHGADRTDTCRQGATQERLLAMSGGKGAAVARDGCIGQSWTTGTWTSTPRVHNSAVCPSRVCAVRAAAVMDATAAGARSPASDGPRLKRRPPIASKAATGLHDGALLRVMSDGLLRISEASALQVADVEADRRRQHRDHPGSKNRPAGGRRGPVPRRPIVAAVQRYLKAAGITDGPLFRRIRKGGQITADRLAADGASLVELQQAGGWHSRPPRRRSTCASPRYSAPPRPMLDRLGAARNTTRPARVDGPLQRWHQGAARAPGGSMPRPAQQGSGGRQVGGLRVGQQPTGGATGGRQLAVSRRTAQTAGR